jgi:hypothetical protein
VLHFQQAESEFLPFFTTPLFHFKQLALRFFQSNLCFEFREEIYFAGGDDSDKVIISTTIEN